MEYEIVELKKKIDNYFTGMLSKEDLGRWSSLEYYDLIKGGYDDKCKLAVYPLIKAVSRFHMKENEIADEYPTTLAEIEEIQSILSGKMDFVFQIKVALPDCLYAEFLKRGYINAIDKRLFFDLYNILTSSDYNAEENSDTVQQILQNILKLKCENNTIHRELKEKIIKISEGILSEKFERKTGANSLGLYVQRQCKTPNLIEKLIEYLECYLGKRNFYVLVSFKNGNVDTTIII